MIFFYVIPLFEKWHNLKMPFPTFFVPLFIKVIFFQTTAWKQYRKCTILLLLQDALIKVLVDLPTCLRCSRLLVYCKIRSLFIQYTIYYTVWTNVRNNENIKWNFANICREDLPMYLPTTNQMPHQLDYWEWDPPPPQLFLSWDSIKGWNWANLDSALINRGLYP